MFWAVPRLPTENLLKIKAEIEARKQVSAIILAEQGRGGTPRSSGPCSLHRSSFISGT
jgi:hypothetical protein